VGFNNLYSGTTPALGICSSRTPGTGITDNVDSATLIWSYNVEADPGFGSVATSPALSIDGTKIAFVETDPGNAHPEAHFHVLAPRREDGVGTNLQTVTTPVSITSFTGTTPTAGTATDLSLFNPDPLSSPFVEYNSDVAYVGDNQGVLYRIINVFCTTPACSGAGSPAPSFDSNWPSGTGGGALSVCMGSQITSPVVDRAGNVFVGCADGKLYGLNSAGVPLTGSPVTVGDGSATGGIVDSPLLDVVNGYIYVVAGNSLGTGTPSVLVQAHVVSDTLSIVSTATLGAGGHFNLHAPTFNEAYFSSAFSGTVANVQGTVNPSRTTSTGNTSNWQIYEWGVSGVSTSEATLYGVGFDSNHVMTSGPASNYIQVTSSSGAEYSPLTQILNGSTDQLYVSARANVFANFLEYNLTDFSPGLFPNVVFPFNPSGATASNSAGASAQEGSGTSGIIVDNVSSAAQASSVYFGVLGSNTAVKLTQSGLN
jgi:hypothetical protein